MKVLSYLLTIFIILLGVTFALLNAQSVEIHYYIGNTALPLSLLLVIALIMGALLGLIVGIVMYVKLKVKNYQLQHRIKLAEKEIENLRAIPLQDNH